MNAVLPARRFARVLAVTTVALLVAACAGVPGNQGDPADPILVRGTVLNKHGVPYAGATLELHVVDEREPSADGTTPVTLDLRFTSDFNGTFVLRVAPTQRLADLAAANGGMVTFRLVAIFPTEFKGDTATFSRGLEAGAWAGEDPYVGLQREPD